MHYFEYATKDTTLYERSSSMNTGLDEILEVIKDTNADGSVVYASRALIKFDLTYVSKSISSGLIPSSSKSPKFYLNLYDVANATFNGVVYPSVDPAIFEIKYPDTDIRGRVMGDI